MRDQTVNEGDAFVIVLQKSNQLHVHCVFFLCNASNSNSGGGLLRYQEISCIRSDTLQISSTRNWQCHYLWFARKEK